MNLIESTLALREWYSRNTINGVAPMNDGEVSKTTGFPACRCSAVRKAMGIKPCRKWSKRTSTTHIDEQMEGFNTRLVALEEKVFKKKSWFSPSDKTEEVMI